MINFDVYGHCGIWDLALTFIIHCECFRSNMGISTKTRVVQVRIVSIPMSLKCVDISVPVPKWLKTLRTQYRSVRRHFGTDAELVRTLRPSTEVSGDTSVPVPKCPETLWHWCRIGQATSDQKRWYQNGLIPKCLDTEMSGNPYTAPINILLDIQLF